jgi:hypothetical protein
MRQAGCDQLAFRIQPEKNVRYILRNFHGKITDELIQSFFELPPDGYLRGGKAFRFRAFSQGVVKSGSALWGDDPTFFQSSDINAYAGGVERNFPPLGAEARAFAEAVIGAPETQELVGNDDFTVGCHQIRVTAADDMIGLPTPEGFHKDGYDYVAVTCVASENVSGGISLVREPSDDGDLLLERVMAPGEILFLADREVLHYVSPITPKLPSRPAYRDVVVVTFGLSADPVAAR